MHLTSHRGRRALVALAATLALAACGSASDDGSATPPAKIRIVAGAGGAALASGEGGRAASAAPADDKMAGGLVPAIGFAPTEWLVEGDLPALDGEAAAWWYPANPDLDVKDVARLAKALGIEGDVREAPAEEGGGWRVGSADYTGPWLSVDRTGLASWYYDSAAFANTRVACAPAAEGGTVAPDVTTSPDPTTAAPGDGASTPADGGAGSAPAVDCPPPTPPADVPSEADAKAKAIALFKALGGSPDAADVQVMGDEWGRYVTWAPRLDGVPTPAIWSAAYGGEGALISASGSLAEAREAAPYPRIGTAKAVELLKAGTAWFGGGPAVMTGAEPAIGSDDVATSPAAPALTAPPMTTGTEGGEKPAVEPGSTGAPDSTEVPEPTVTEPMEPYRVTITGVEAALTMLYGVDGEVWLVPAYRFTGPQGEVALVPAIDASYVEQVVPTGQATDAGVARSSGSAVAGSSGGSDSPVATKP